MVLKVLRQIFDFSLSVSRWNTARRGSASCWVTAPVVANQCDPASAGSVAAAAGEFRAWPWGCWYCPLPSPLSLLSSHYSSISLPLTPLSRHPPSVILQLLQSSASAHSLLCRCHLPSCLAYRRLCSLGQVFQQVSGRWLARRTEYSDR